MSKNQKKSKSKKQRDEEVEKLDGMTNELMDQKHPVELIKEKYDNKINFMEREKRDLLDRISDIEEAL